MSRTSADSADLAEMQGHQPSAAGLARLDATKAQFRRGPQGQVRLILPDCCHLRVTLTRAFPLSHPDDWIAVRGADGSDLGLLPGLAGMDAESRTCAQEELRLRYFTPQVKAILDLRDETPGGRHGGTIWDLETDRGPATLRMPNTNEHIQSLGGNRLLLSDSAGNRYEIADLRALDAASRWRVSKYVWL